MTNDKHMRLTLTELQRQLPWSIEYSPAFLGARADLPYLDFEHALLHVVKATGKLAAMVEDADHGRDFEAPDFKVGELAKLLADLVICALRMANTQPRTGYAIDLGKAVVERLESKNGIALRLPDDKLTPEQRIDVESIRRDAPGQHPLAVIAHLLVIIDQLAPKPKPRAQPKIVPICSGCGRAFTLDAQGNMVHAP